jgi:hypothetical protein
MVGDRYRIVALLGRGGMGEVYRADDLTVGQPVALKFLPPRFAKDLDRLARLRGEVRAARQVSHPNVCRVYDIFDVGGEHFISMELVQGEDLAALLRRIGRLPVDKAQQIAGQLCAGLAAAHAQGVLHRDLKPSNVMLDERGTARIMDFGLSGALADVQGAVGEGTPAYMAPEQLAGRAVGVPSDIYALGLVLYELFTGKTAFTTSTPPEMLRERENESPLPPTRLVDGVDDATERAILRCLESDPALRPASALAVAAMLPGGDPLASALAAGETPSPDMVAASGGKGALRPAAAWALLASGLLLTLATLGLSSWSKDVGVSPLPRSADALADHAKDVLRSLGYDESADDSVCWFDRNYDYLLWEAAHAHPARRVRPWPGALNFVCRFSPRPLAPYTKALVTEDDPPPQLSGMATVRLAPDGELLMLTVVPPQLEDTGASWPEPDWAAVLGQTRLDASRLLPAPPRWTPPVASEVRKAWEGAPWPDRPPVRVEAAAFHGRVVHVDVVGPWAKPTRMVQAPARGEHWLRVVLQRTVPQVVVTGVLTVGVILARRNVRLSRGDRRGALRVAGAVALTYLVRWVLETHHVAEVSSEWRLFLANASLGLFYAGFVWLSYMALEPYVRRRWPSILVGWNRALAGQWRDPLVGRDVLRGSLAGTLVAVLHHVANAAPAWLPLAGQTPIPVDRLVLGGTAEMVALFVGGIGSAIIWPLAMLGVLFVARLVVDRPGPAGALTAFVLSLMILGTENLGVESVAAVISGMLIALVLTRYGLLALASLILVAQVLFNFPVTLELGRWYAGASIFALAVMAVMLAYGFRTALGDRAAFTVASPRGRIDA